MRLAHPTQGWKNKPFRAIFKSAKNSSQHGLEQLCCFCAVWPPFDSKFKNINDFNKKLIWPADQIIKNWSLGWFHSLATDWEWIDGFYYSFIRKFGLPTAKPSSPSMQDVTFHLSTYFNYSYYVKQVHYRLRVKSYGFHFFQNQTSAQNVFMAIRKTAYDPKRLRPKKAIKKKKKSEMEISDSLKISDDLFEETQDTKCIERQHKAPFVSVAAFPMVKPNSGYDYQIRLRLFRQSYTMDHNQLRDPTKTASTVWCVSCDQALSYTRFYGVTKMLKKKLDLDAKAPLPPKDDYAWRECMPKNDQWIDENKDNIMCPKCVASHLKIFDEVNITPYL